MKYQKLPNSDLYVSSICMGGMVLSDLNNLESCIQIFDKYVEMGGNVIDTANIYGKRLAGTNICEIELGNWMEKRKNRSKLIISTKGGHPRLDAVQIPRVNKADVDDDLNESLAALKTDYVDIYWMHRDDENKPAGEIVDFLADCKRKGKIRYFGISNWKQDRVEEVIQYTRGKFIDGFIGCQIMWSLATPNWDNIKDKTLVVMDDDMKKYHKEHNLPVFAFSSQARGFFEKLNDAEKDPKTQEQFKKLSGGWLHQNLYKVYFNENNYARYKRVCKFAQDRGMSITQVVLGYIISQPFPAIPIIGSNNVEQVMHSMKAGEVCFSEADISYLENGA